MPSHLASDFSLPVRLRSVLVLRTRLARHSSLILVSWRLLRLGRNAPIDVAPRQRLDGSIGLCAGGHGAVTRRWRGRQRIIGARGLCRRNQREQCAAAGKKCSDRHGRAPFPNGEEPTAGGGISAHRVPGSQRNCRWWCGPLSADTQDTPIGRSGLAVGARCHPIRLWAPAEPAEGRISGSSCGAR
jgi:hypothetical protein